MARIRVEPGVELSCEIDDFLWPWADADAVFMVHGYARSTRFWDRWIPPIAGRRRIYRLDLRGCGQSDPPSRDHRFEPAGILADVRAVMDALRLKKVHWVGESSSGVLGIAFAASYPERVSSLVLCDTPFRIPDGLKSTYALDQPSTADAVLRYGVDAWCRSTLQYRLDLDHAGPELREWYVNAMLNTPAYVAAAYIRCFEAVDVTPMLPQVQAPVLLLSGDKSKIAAEQQQRLKQSLPNATLHQFQGYGHGVSVLIPEQCAQAAVSFWETLAKRGDTGNRPGSPG